jgi:hypothetical protein
MTLLKTLQWIHVSLKAKDKPGMVVHICNPITWEAEADFTFQANLGSNMSLSLSLSLSLSHIYI